MINRATLREAGSGIYLIRHLASGRIYVGQSKRLLWRIQGHFSQLRKKSHINDCMQDAFNNDGVDGFEVEILESITDVDGLKKSLKIQESFWITQYLNSGHNFFNVFASNTFEGITYRGWQADLARRLEISPVSVTQKLSS